MPGKRLSLETQEVRRQMRHWYTLQPVTVKMKGNPKGLGPSVIRPREGIEMVMAERCSNFISRHWTGA